MATDYENRKQGEAVGELLGIAFVAAVLYWSTKTKKIPPLPPPR